MTAAPRRTLGQRYRAMRTRWNEDWWSITFGGPLGNLANAVIADVPWITPNRITWLSFACKVAAVPLLLHMTAAADVAAIVLMQLHVVLDCMDGNLARYRKAGSAMGTFLDKVTDMIGLVAIAAALGWRIGVEDGDPHGLVVSTLVASTIVIRNYVYWVVHAIVRDRGVAKPADPRPDCSQLTFGERARLYAKSQVRVFAFAESDLYFWYCLALVVGELRWITYGLAVVTGIWFVAVLGVRFVTVLRLDRAAAAAKGAS